MSRYVDRLIDQVRRETENEDVTATTGITSAEFIQYLNDAQHRLQSLIASQHNHVFVEEAEFTVTPGVDTYTLPKDIYLENKVSSVEYRAGALDEDYYHLPRISLNRRASYSEGFPSGYIRKSGKIILQPVPDQAGTVRLQYIRRITELDLRRAVVKTFTSSGTSVASLVADTASTSPSFDRDSLLDHNYICIVDRDGELKMKNIPITGINNTTGEISVDPSFVFESDEAVAAGDYIVGGRDTVTHSELPRMCERYLLAYCAWKIFKRDSSVDYSEQQQELLQMESDIVNSFAVVDDDIRYIPILNDEFNWDD